MEKTNLTIARLKLAKPLSECLWFTSCTLGLKSIT
jgi:hypothetical protein